MSADLLISAIAVPAGQDHLDWDAAHIQLEATPTPDDFGWEDLDVDGMDHDDLESLIFHGHQVLADIEDALGSSGTTVIEIGDYWVHLSGGLSWGDVPTKEYAAIIAAYGLPDAVLRAAGFIPDPSRPLSRRAGNKGPISSAPPSVTDADVVDAIALGLGTKSEWSSDELEWIPSLIGRVRPHPGDPGSPAEYLARWKRTFGEDAVDDSFFAGYIDDEAYEDPALDEEVTETTPDDD